MNRLIRKKELILHLVPVSMKGLQDFDIDEAYKGMYKSATTPGNC